MTPHSLNVFSLIFQPTQAAWRVVFFVAASIYILGATFYLIFASGARQTWDDRRTQPKENLKNVQIMESKAANDGFEPTNVFGIINRTFEDKKV